MRPPLLLDGRPWPTDANGRYLEGITTVLVELDYTGKVVGDCIDKSSGQPALDAFALRRAESLTYTPAIYRGWPIGAYARLPVAFSLDRNQQAQVPTQQTKGGPACKTQRVAGESASVPDQELTVWPSADGAIPASQPSVPWPVAQDGRPAQADVHMIVLVDAAGVTVDALVRGKGGPGSLDDDAYRRAFSMHGASGMQHWEFLHVHYRADGGSAISEGEPDQAATHAPSPRGGIRVFRNARGMFVDGGAWPRAKSGLYLHSIVLVEAFVNTEGRVANARLKRGSRVAAFDQRALTEVRRRQYLVPLQAHWMTVPVEFVPITDPKHATGDSAPPGHSDSSPSTWNK